MALLEDALGGWGGIAVGVGAAMAFPAIGPAIGAVVRPAAKALIRGSLVVSDQFAGLAGAAAGGVRQLVAEAQAETRVRGTGSSAPRQAPKAIRS